MLQAIWGGASSASTKVEVALESSQTRKTTNLGRNKEGVPVFIYTDGEDVAGTASVTIRPGQKKDHSGLKLEIVGRVEVLNDSSASYTFFSVSKELEPPGTLFETKHYRWKFSDVEMPSETYSGSQARLRYFVRATLVRGYHNTLAHEADFAVQNIEPEPALDHALKLEVGIEDCLHIEFEYSKSKYHLKDVLCGKVYFVLARIKIKHMELAIVRRETVGQQTSSDTVHKFEIMDGAPLRNECIPVRMYFGGLDLSPTYKGEKFTVRYFVNLVLYDEEDRRYFKQSEITLWRQKISR